MTVADLSLREIEWKKRYSQESDNPLRDFYVPALSRSLRYDRKTGYFSSSALAAAAQGVARLIRNGGHMRLLVSCHLMRGDIEAIERGYKLRSKVAERLLADWQDPANWIQRRRLQALAWMISSGTLEVKVAIPIDTQGRLQPREDTDELYHEKVGIFYDAHGDRIAFSGSINETGKAWLDNRESFHVFTSWDEPEHVAAEEDEFEKLWRDEGETMRVIDFPQALRERVLEHLPDEAPDHDPEETNELPEEELARQRERWLFQFLRDAPHMPNGDLIAEAFSTVKLWPHQKKLADKVVATYPDPYLLCDEVGLGKTIEAGVIIARLILSGRVKRCLILVPKAVLSQWQEELIEKFNLNTWQYTGSGFVDAHGNETPEARANPWNTHDVIIASSHLAKRRERAPILVEADKWDLVVVDEAHHGRRMSGKAGEYRPNRLLRLLQQMRDRARCMLLMTATPMQLDPVEVWDLMHSVGLGGRWGALRGDLFRNYFDELRSFPDEADLHFLGDMLADYFAHGGDWDEDLLSTVQSAIGPVKTTRLRKIADTGELPSHFRTWTEEELGHTTHFLRGHTPLRRYVFRYTRDLLKNYRDRGLLHENIPEREVHDQFLAFRSDQERELYNRIEEYIREVYTAAQQQNPTGIGFVMTIYRRRLTSSLYAISESLRRRRAYLVGEEMDTPGGLVEEDYADDDLDHDVSEDLEQEEKSSIGVAREIEYIDDFVSDIQQSLQDTKLRRLTDDLNDYLRTHNTVMVFTQYTDTMEYLRDELRMVYGTQVACYSGRGGERWNGERWAFVSKEVLKGLFARGEDVKILLCTEAASEGLNLQTCSLLINYDMPWNPMKVEQRIGRIDRIGQREPVVTVINYFYEDTVEADIHRRLGERINWFEWVVGPLQPILSQLPELIREAALVDPEERTSRIAQIVDDLLAQYERRQEETLNVDELARTEDLTEGNGQLAPIDPSQVRQTLTGSALLGGEEMFTPGDTPGTYQMQIEGESATITFSPNVYDERPDTVDYHVYGSDPFTRTLALVGTPNEMRNPFPFVRVTASCGGEQLVRYFALSEDGEARPIEGLDGLQAALQSQRARDASSADPATLKDLRTQVATELEERVTASKQRVLAELKGRLDATQWDARDCLDDLLAIDFCLGGYDLGDLEEDSEPVDVTYLLTTQLRDQREPYPALVSIIGNSPTAYVVPAHKLRSYVGKAAESLAASRGRALGRVTSLIENYRDLEQRVKDE